MGDDVDIDDLSEIEAKERLEQEQAKLEELEKEYRELLIEQRRKQVELRCLEYVEFQIACEESVEDKPVFYPETDPLRN